MDDSDTYKQRNKSSPPRTVKGLTSKKLLDETEFSQSELDSLSVEVEELKQEYNSLKFKFRIEQGSSQDAAGQLIKLEVSKMELLRKVIREKEQKLFILRLKRNK